MNKDLIQNRFSRCLNTYDKNAKIQKLMANRLIQILDNKHFNNILEIGCGTGFLTRNIIKNITFNNYIANDIVPECKNIIQEISSDINFINGDVENFIKNDNNKFNLIISNATFQWIDNIEDFLLALYNKLEPNGILLFSVFGDKNFQEISKIYGKSLTYHTSEEYKKIFKNHEIFTKEETHVITFKTPLEILKHLKYTGVNAIAPEKWTKTDLKDFEYKYNKMCNNLPTLTYNPIYIKITKN